MAKTHTCPRCGQTMDVLTPIHHYVCGDCRRSLYPWLTTQSAGL